MKDTHTLETGGLYLFESLSSANSIFFKTKNEIKVFKKLIFRYLGRYLEIRKLYIDVNGYQLVVRIRQRRTIIKNYKKECEEKGRMLKEEFKKHPWKIISEKMRIFKSTFVKAINWLRGREGVLVKNSYKKQYFETEKEYEDYVEGMERGMMIKSQRSGMFSRRREETRVRKWGDYRARKWVEMLVPRDSPVFVARISVLFTLLHHSTQSKSKYTPYKTNSSQQKAKHTQ